MASNKLAAYRLKQLPLDVWTMREKLALSCSVMRSGDQNWVSVSRTIKPFGETHRPGDWFSPKNCALQYADLLEKIETPKRKRGEKSEVIETPQVKIVQNLTVERIEELKRLVTDIPDEFKTLKAEIEDLKNGKHDDNIKEYWEQIQSEVTAKDEAEAAIARKQAEEYEARAERIAKAKALSKVMVPGQKSPKKTPPPTIRLKIPPFDDTTQDSIISEANSIDILDEDTMPGTPINLGSVSMTMQSDDASKPTSPSSPLLSSVLKFDDDITAIKEEKDGETTLEQLEIKVDPFTDGYGTDSEMQVDVTETVESSTGLEDIKSEISDELKDVGLSDDEEEVLPLPEIEEFEVAPSTVEVVNESVVETNDDNILRPPTETLPIDIDQPPSPASSVSSKISESGTKGKKRLFGRGRGKGRKSISRSIKKSVDEDKKEDGSGESSGEETDDAAAGISAKGFAIPVFADSIPNSPASQCSDTDDDKAHKAWKKSIMLVWRAAATHKFANLFLHPVTNEIAPGYHNIVYRPMDLSVIKKNIESGIIRTTSEFQRDVMLMFTNALMYNNSNQDVYNMTREMYDDVMVHIEVFLQAKTYTQKQYVSTQMMLQSAETKVLRTSRRSDCSDKEDDRRRRMSVDLDSGGKAKKRKT